MSKILRSKQGCWTCRLRKKKCDENRPICSSCEKLKITCYGYGSRPDWLDGGEREKAVAEALKQGIKHAPRRKIVSGHSTRRLPSHELAPKFTESAVEKSLPHPSKTDLQNPETTTAGGIGIQTSSATQIGSNETVEFSLSAEDFILLMHFLDKILPLQFPVYDPSPQEGGRGWILPILLRTKPLFHAAMALSSYHRRLTSLDTQECGPCAVTGILQQESHLESCLKEFRSTMSLVNDFVKGKGPQKQGLRAELSSLQLVFFEVFTGENKETWRIHLSAATSMLQLLYKKCFTNSSCLNISPATRNNFFNDLKITNESSNDVQEIACFRFVVASILWLDTLSSITSGTAPTLFDLHYEILIQRSQINMSKIIGLENWVVLQLGRVVSLHTEQKKDREEGKTGTMWANEYKRKGGDISFAVEIGIKKLGEIAPEAFETPRILQPHPSEEQRGKIATKIYALAVLVYLDLVTFGYYDTPRIDSGVNEAIEILTTTASGDMVPILIPALFILGSAARNDEDKELFRGIFSPKTFLQPFYKHRWKILPVLEEIWRRKDSSLRLLWDEVVGMMNDVLLL